MKTTSKVLGSQGFSLTKSCKCQNLNSLFREISFLELSKYSWNLQMLSIIEKLKNWKNFLKNSRKIGTPFGKRSWKIGSPVQCWHTKLNNWHTFDTLTHLLARWHVKNKLARVWHFGTLAHGHVDHAGTHSTYGMRFSKLMYPLWKCKCDHENYLTSSSKISLSGRGLLDHILCEWRLVDIILSECGLFWVREGGWSCHKISKVCLAILQYYAWKCIMKSYSCKKVKFVPTTFLLRLFY